MTVRTPDTLESLLLKPYFWRRPSQLVRRVAQRHEQLRGPVVVRLPWGLDLECNPLEMIGDSIIRTGVFEIATTEALVRLVDPGELVLDVGANIGYMTGLLATAAQPGGRVVAYEPNPTAYQRLVANIGRWQGKKLAAIDVRDAAVSDRNGTAPLTVPERGDEWAALGTAPTERAGSGPHRTVEVRTVTLDDEIGDAHVGVLKLDVEDHEPAALRGAWTALAERRIRELVFEDHAPYPSETTKLLEGHGYVIFDLAARPLGLTLRTPAEHLEQPSWDAPMRIATMDPDRTRRRIAPRGWISLRSPSRWSTMAARPRR
jgi:FkbM family methyltransferase